MKARDVMTRPVTTVSPDAQIQQIAKTMMNRHISAVPVVSEDGVLLGIVSEGDLMRHDDAGTQVPAYHSWWLKIIADPVSRAGDYVKQHGRFARDVMTKNVVTVDEDTAVPKIAALLEKYAIKRVPVMSNGRVTGIVSRANLLYGLAALDASAETLQSDTELKDVIDAAIDEAGIRPTYFNVVVTDGVARLWGAVESTQEADALRVIIENIEGLQNLENNVRVVTLPGAYS